MDVRGVEVTNQLRSAIRAKLLELSVQYDDELPDYILVMVVNKKSRKQMYEDLYLFLDESTSPFVDWLHDQVLKKLQKVSISKKKSTSDFVTTAIKHEEKKKKQNILLTENFKIKEEQTVEKTPSKSSQPKQKSMKEIREIQNDSLHSDSVQSKIPTAPTQEIPDESTKISEEFKERVGSVSTVSKQIPIETNTPQHSEKEYQSTETQLDSKELSEEEYTPEKRIKSCINKPRIASVVSIKNRLGVTPYRKNFESYGDKNKNNDFDNHSKIEKKWDKPFYKPLSRENYRRQNFNEDLSYNANHNKTNSRQTFPNNRSHVAKQDEKESNKRSGYNTKVRSDVSSSNIKDRLGITKAKFTETFNDNSNEVRSRFSAVKRRFQALEKFGSSSDNHDEGINRGHNSYQKVSRIIEKEKEEDQDKNIPIKSHIIAVSTFMKEKSERQKLRNTEQEIPEEETEERVNCDTKSLGSKVIVTPRPLKPLQPVLKRATQSLLLRAVDEANQSVVKQKNPEPLISEKKSVFKRLQSPATKDVDQNLSVRLNTTKRFVMEKIQIELTNPESEPDTKSELHLPMAVTDEQIDVVMSLFQHSDDTQKFLVTLNGYDTDTTKDQQSPNDEPMEIKINEDDEHALTNSSSESSTQNESDDLKTLEPVDISEEFHEHENNENLNIIEEVPRKRRKLSPITYSRSPSPIFQEQKVQSTIYLGSQPAVTTVILNEKLKEKCRYWPNCTLGAKCAYSHSPVPCSLFPACKFSNCIYEHPKCKFGLSCTKVGCVFSHPSRQCKYHPFCTKPGCVYFHPKPAIHHHQPASQVDTTPGKFTWRRQN